MTQETYGAGRLILIVGPSGAGKDTLIDYARQALRSESRVRFVRRVITRPPSAGEDHQPLAPDIFEAAAEQGAFALHWSAHGLRYGLPAVIDAWISQGDTVVANSSRAILAEARRRYPDAQIVNITAAPDILAARLAGRGRETGDECNSRMARNASIPADITDIVTIDNSGVITDGAAALVALIAGPARRSTTISNRRNLP